jgi:putative peptidoglycan lipid II flippase
LINIVLILFLIHPLQQAGLALATALASSVNATLLLYGLIKRKHYQSEIPWLGFSLKILFSSCLMAALLYYLSGSLSLWLHWDLWQKAWRLLVCIASGVGVYLFLVVLLGIRKKDFVMHRSVA